MSHTTPAICYPSSSVACSTSAMSYQIPSVPTSITAYSTPSALYGTAASSVLTHSAYAPKTGITGLGSLGTATHLGHPTSLVGHPSSLTGGSAALTNFSSSVPTAAFTSHPFTSTQSYVPGVASFSLPSSYPPPAPPPPTFGNSGVTFSNPLSAPFTNPISSLSGPVGMNIKLKPLEESDIGASRRVATPCTPHPPAWAGLSSTLGDTRPLSRMLPDGLDACDWGLHNTSNFLNGHASTEAAVAAALGGQVDMLDIPGKGRCSVYMARFSYDPDPDAADDELAVSAGDYLLVWGEPTGPGSYLDAELLDGRRGLVPSHFCTRLVGDDLLEFHQAVLSTLRDEDACAAEYVADLQRLSEMAELSEGHEDDTNDADTGTFRCMSAFAATIASIAIVQQRS